MISLPGLAQAKRDSQVGLAVLSTGTWTTYGKLDGFDIDLYDNGVNHYSFNKILSVALYGKLLGQPAYFALPLAWTAKYTDAGDDHRIAPGDGEFYLGQKWGLVEGRIGLIFPAGYDTHDGSPWIGPGNLQATVGLAVNPKISRYSKRWDFSAEAKWAYTLDDAIAKAGTWGLYPSAKVSFRPNKTWKWGGEGLVYWKSAYWSKSATFAQAVLGAKTGVNGPKAYWNAGVVPTFFGEYYGDKKLWGGQWAFGVKGGHSLWGYRDAASYNASVYWLFFP